MVRHDIEKTSEHNELGQEESELKKLMRKASKMGQYHPNKSRKLVGEAIGRAHYVSKFGEAKPEEPPRSSKSNPKRFRRDRATQ